MNNITRNDSKLHIILAVNLLVLAFILLQPDRALAQVSGSGTIGRIPKWGPTSQTNLEDSIITELSGKIGIGTANPDSLFHVFGNGSSIFTRTFTGSLGNQQGAMQLGLTGGTMTIGGGPSLLFFSDIVHTLQPKQFMGRVSSVWENPIQGSEAASLVFSVRANTDDATASTERMRITSAGNVGIGTTTPNMPLTVKKNALGEVQVRITSNTTDFYLGAEWVSGVPAIGTNTLTPMTLVTGNVERFRIDPLGNVGIGTASPDGGTLHIRNKQGAIGTTLIVENIGVLASNDGGTIDLKLLNNVVTRIKGNYFEGTSISTFSTLDALRILDNGKILLGAPNQTTAAHGIQFGTDSSANLYRSASATIRTDGTLHANTFLSNNISSTSVTTSLITSSGALSLTPAANNNLNVTLSSSSNFAVNSNQLYVSAAKVGINTTAPSTALHVVGDITVTGNINAKYQDVAEWVPARTALSAGTVVVLDPEQSNQVMASSLPYDTRVAGVISKQPGLILGEGGAGKVMVATTGRVRMKVDATNAPIGVGDLLVTSNQEGVAMRSEPLDLAGAKIHRPGTIIGKALEPLAKGKGEILVLLSMQ